MELQNMKTVTIFTLDSALEPVKVTSAVSGGYMPAGKLYTQACSSLGLKESSCKCFSLFDGTRKPCRRYSETDNIPASNTALCLRKWCFSEELEKNVVKNDAIAAHLIYLEARQHVEEGNVKYSKEEESQLEELSDPGFVLEGQYVLLCHTLVGYWSVRADNCVIKGDIQINNTEFISNSKVSLILDKQWITFKASVNQPCQVSWYSVKAWCHFPESQTLQYDIQTDDQQSVSIRLTSDQSQYLLAVTREIITVMQSTVADSPKFFSSMIKSAEDGGTSVENALFDPHKAKSSITT